MPCVVLAIFFVWALLVMLRPRGPQLDADTHRSVGGYGGEYNDWEQR